MAQLAHATTTRLAAMLGAPTGLPTSFSAISQRENVKLGELTPRHVLRQSVAADLAERTAGAQYPMFYVYCEKITNELREKFRTFSGRARLCVDVRVSHDRLEDLTRMLELHVEAVTNVLDSQRGDWGGGVFFAGGYEVTFGATKHGGKNFIQTAKVAFDVDVSVG